MDVYIGLDVSLVSTEICVLGEKGKIVTQAQVASAPDSLVAFIRDRPRGRSSVSLAAQAVCNGAAIRMHAICDSEDSTWQSEPRCPL